MARTPLLASLRRALERARLRERGWSDAAIDDARRAGLSRRALLGGAVAAVAGATLAGCGAGAVAQPEGEGGAGPSPRPVAGDGAPRIAVVGAGLAGLVAAWRLQAEGFDVTVFEASDRVGGRTYSTRDHFSGGRVAELGGELINSDHCVMLALARTFGEPLDDRTCVEHTWTPEIWRVGGRTLDEHAIATAFQPLCAAMETAWGDEDAWRAAEAMSIDAFLAAHGADADLTALLCAAYTAEMGLDSSEQSAMNLIDQLMSGFDPSEGDCARLDCDGQPDAADDEAAEEEAAEDEAAEDEAAEDEASVCPAEAPEHLALLGASDERYHLRNGNDRIATHLAEALAGRVRTGCWLRRVDGGDEDGVTLTFETTAGDHAETFARAVIAIPLGTLRDVAFGVPMGSRTAAIDELGFGTNSKLMSLYREPVWRTRHGSTGTVVADAPMHMLWDTTFASPGFDDADASAVLTNFVGGQEGVAIGEGDADAVWRARLVEVEAIFPGITEAWTGETARFVWPTRPTAKGSYLCHRPGQWSRWYGRLAEPIGRLHFAGEHTSVAYFGYMEGAAESGLRAAGEVVEAMGGDGAAVVAAVLGDASRWETWSEVRGLSGWDLWNAL